MGGTESSDEATATDRWNRTMRQLAAGPRRRIVLSLLDVPDERRLPLPDAAASKRSPVDPETFAVELRHRHLPMLADAGYVQWEDDPFCVWRGPAFEEAGAIMRTLVSSADRLPEAMVEDCGLLEERVV